MPFNQIPDCVRHLAQILLARRGLRCGRIQIVGLIAAIAVLAGGTAALANAQPTTPEGSPTDDTSAPATPTVQPTAAPLSRPVPTVAPPKAPPGTAKPAPPVPSPPPPTRRAPPITTQAPPPPVSVPPTPGRPTAPPLTPSKSRPVNQPQGPGKPGDAQQNPHEDCDFWAGDIEGCFINAWNSAIDSLPKLLPTSTAISTDSSRTQQK
jgi:outer membrane biosynthesis protein TonB